MLSIAVSFAGRNSALSFGGRLLRRNQSVRLLRFVGLMLAVISSADCRGADDFVGHWALTIPSGAAGWLGVEEVDGKLNASLLWGGGSVKPLDSAVAERG